MKGHMSIWAANERREGDGRPGAPPRVNCARAHTRTCLSGRSHSLPADLPRAPGRAEAQKERGGPEDGHPGQRRPRRGAGAAVLRALCRVVHGGGRLRRSHPGRQASEGRSSHGPTALRRPLPATGSFSCGAHAVAFLRTTVSPAPWTKVWSGAGALFPDCRGNLRYLHVYKKEGLRVDEVKPHVPFGVLLFKN